MALSAAVFQSAPTHHREGACVCLQEDIDGKCAAFFFVVVFGRKRAIPAHTERLQTKAYLHGNFVCAVFLQLSDSEGAMS